jgi:hypothetical protein
MSKNKVLTVLDKKISNADNEGRAIEKQFYKGDMNLKNFMESFIQKRKDFHKYSIMKVKVNQS